VHTKTAKSQLGNITKFQLAANEKADKWNTLVPKLKRDSNRLASVSFFFSKNRTAYFFSFSLFYGFGTAYDTGMVKAG
jgi:hypothetical protein